MWEGVITQPDGNVRTKVFETAREAEAWIREPGRWLPKGSLADVVEV